MKGCVERESLGVRDAVDVWVLCLVCLDIVSGYYTCVRGCQCQGVSI